MRSLGFEFKKQRMKKNYKSSRNKFDGKKWKFNQKSFCRWEKLKIQYFFCSRENWRVERLQQQEIRRAKTGFDECHFYFCCTSASSRFQAVHACKIKMATKEICKFNNIFEASRFSLFHFLIRETYYLHKFTVDKNSAAEVEVVKEKIKKIWWIILILIVLYFQELRWL